MEKIERCTVEVKIAFYNAQKFAILAPEFCKIEIIQQSGMKGLLLSYGLVMPWGIKNKVFFLNGCSIKTGEGGKGH